MKTFVIAGLAVLTISLPLMAYDLKMTLKEREDALFQLLDLDYPGLEKVKAAEKAGDRAAAKAALVDYYRQRTNVKWRIDRAKRPKEPV